MSEKRSEEKSPSQIEEVSSEEAKVSDSEKLPQEKWDEVRQGVETIGDRLGYRIDENIKDTVASLMVHGINTSGSCEGHIDSGLGAPWVEIDAPNEPDEIYKGEKEILERVARENNVTVEDLRMMDNEKNIKLYRDAMNECAANGETEEMIAWEKENEKLKIVMEKVLDEFYQSRETSEEAKIKFEDIGGFGTFRIYSGSKEDYDREAEKMTDEDKGNLDKRLGAYRQEMQEFSQFMKDKFFKEGTGYISGIRKEVQEEIDANKIDQIRGLIQGQEVSTENNQERILKEKIQEVIKLPFGVARKAEIILIMLGEKPALEFDTADNGEFQDSIKTIEGAGLKASISHSGEGKVKVLISKEQSTIDELNGLSPASDSNHKRYGNLMGFPDTAVEAFLDKTKQLDPEEQRTLTKDLPHFFAFRMSKKHSVEELNILKKWNKLILKYAPELFDELYPSEESDRFKKNVERM